MSHLTLSDRIIIESGLNEQKTLSQISERLRKHTSTISREIQNNLIVANMDDFGRIINQCVHKNTCNMHGICVSRINCTRKCSDCFCCNNVCLNFTKIKCEHLEKSPHVCNGCEKERRCKLVKTYYRANDAHNKYRSLLSNSRKGYNITYDELECVNNVVSPLLKQGQSIHHIYINNSDKLNCSESTIARLIKGNMLDATIFDQERAVKLKPRQRKRNVKKIEYNCRKGRTLEDYREYMTEHPNAVEVEIDTVIGTIGGKCLLTIIFPDTALMLAFICESKTASCIQSKFDYLYNDMQGRYNYLFEVILTDNGTEFSNPSAIETASDGTTRSHVFYCDPKASWQKPHVERNHRLIRKILPKGTSFNNLTQKDIGLMMSHINSYKRKSLSNHSPIEIFYLMYGENLLDRLLTLSKQKMIKPNDINLTPKLLT